VDLIAAPNPLSAVGLAAKRSRRAAHPPSPRELDPLPGLPRRKLCAGEGSAPRKSCSVVDVLKVGQEKKVRICPFRIVMVLYSRDQEKEAIGRGAPPPCYAGGYHSLGRAAHL
jgi:hypothetical protein